MTTFALLIGLLTTAVFLAGFALAQAVMQAWRARNTPTPKSRIVAPIGINAGSWYDRRF